MSRCLGILSSEHHSASQLSDTTLMLTRMYGCDIEVQLNFGNANSEVSPKYVNVEQVVLNRIRFYIQNGRNPQM